MFIIYVYIYIIYIPHIIIRIPEFTQQISQHDRQCPPNSTRAAIHLRALGSPSTPGNATSFKPQPVAAEKNTSPWFYMCEWWDRKIVIISKMIINAHGNIHIPIYIYYIYIHIGIQVYRYKDPYAHTYIINKYIQYNYCNAGIYGYINNEPSPSDHHR